MNRVRAVMPVLPVPLIAAALQEHGGAIDRKRLEAFVADRAAHLSAAGVRVHLADADGTEHPGSLPATVAHGLEALLLRRIIVQEGEILRVAPDERQTLAFYAASIAHLLDAVAAPPKSLET
jgi:glycerol-3-phosphate O-acyltransferase